MGVLPPSRVDARPCHSSVVSTTRQAHRKHRAFARVACHGHVAAHHARKLARQRKAEARPAIAARGQGISLGEVLEQFRLLLGAQADATVGDGKPEALAVMLA
jgi:hypothetical protein